MKQGQIIYQGKSKSGKDILIRYPTWDDTQILLDYINTLSKEQTFIRFQGEQLTFEEEKKYLEEQSKLIEEGKSVILLVFCNSKLIGDSNVTLRDKISSHVGILGISLAKGYRGEGIGTLLMEKALEEGKKNLVGIKIVSLGVFANNKVAISLYKKMGFKEHGRLPNGVKYKGGFVDHLYMYKEI